MKQTQPYRSALAELEQLGRLPDDRLTLLSPCLRSTIQASQAVAQEARRRMNYPAAATWLRVSRAAGELLQRADEACA